MNKKRKAVEEMILSTVKKLDKTNTIYNYYNEFFNSMDDKQFNSFMLDLKNKKSALLFETDQDRNPFNLKDVESALNNINESLEEYVYFKHMNPGGEPTRTPTKCIVINICEKRMQQHVSKKNGISTSNTERNPISGTVTGSDKNGILSDVEVTGLTVHGSKYIAKELLGVRADHMRDKEVAMQNISRNGYFSLSDLPDKLEDKTALHVLMVYFLGAGINTDLVSNSLVLPYTVDKKKSKRVRG